MAIRPRRAWRDRSRNSDLHDPGALPADLAVRRGRGGAPLKRCLEFALLSVLVTLTIISKFSVSRVAAQQANDAPGRGQSVADTLEAIQKARVVTRVVFIVAHPDDEASTLMTYLPHALVTDM